VPRRQHESRLIALEFETDAGLGFPNHVCRPMFPDHVCRLMKRGDEIDIRMALALLTIFLLQKQVSTACDSL
jgi:hypothetical protein